MFTAVGQHERRHDFHCMGNADIIAGEDLRTHILARSRMNGSKEIQGATCLTRGKEVAANIRLATAHAKKFWNSKTDSPRKSGNNSDETCLYVRKEMWKRTVAEKKRKKSKKLTVLEEMDKEDMDGEQDREQNEEETDKMPVGKFFCGYWAFRQWGIVASRDQQKSNFALGDILKEWQEGRAKKRAKNRTRRIMSVMPHWHQLCQEVAKELVLKMNLRFQP